MLVCAESVSVNPEWWIDQVEEAGSGQDTVLFAIVYLDAQ